MTQRAVVHVDGAGPRDSAGVEAERVAVVQVGIEHRRQKVVRARNGVEVAREVEVDVLHGDDLRVAAARRAAFHPEHGSERRLADAERGVLADLAERLRHADRDRRLALARRRRIDSGHQHQAASRLATRQRAKPHLRLVLAVQLDLVVVESQFRCDVRYRAQPRRLGDGDVGGYFGRGGHTLSC